MDGKRSEKMRWEECEMNGEEIRVFLLMAGAQCIQCNDYADLNMITGIAGGLTYQYS